MRNICARGAILLLCFQHLEYEFNFSTCLFVHVIPIHVMPLLPPGTMFEACLAWAVIPSLGWRWLLAFSAVPLLLLLILYPWVPESPHWLLMQGRVQEAEQVVLKVAAINRYHRQMRLRFGAAVSRKHAMAGSITHPGTRESSPNQASGQHEHAAHEPGAVSYVRDDACPPTSTRATKAAADDVAHSSLAVVGRVGVVESTEWLLGEQQLWQGEGPSVRRVRRRPHEEGATRSSNASSVRGQSSARSGVPNEEEGEGIAGKPLPSAMAALTGGATTAVVIVEEEHSEVGEAAECTGGGRCQAGIAAAAHAVSKSWRRIFKGMRAAFKELYGPRLLKSSLLLYLIWCVLDPPVKTAKGRVWDQTCLVAVCGYGWSWWHHLQLLQTVKLL